jgi:hypothetical protein
VEWLVQLAGHRFDLEELPDWLDGGPFSVLEAEGAYFLKSEYFTRFTDPREVRRAAEDIVELANGLGRVQWQEFQPISVGAVETRTSDGSRKVHISASERVLLRDKAKVVVKDKNGVVQPSKSRGKLTAWMEVAGEDALVQRAIGYLNRPGVTWNDLYRTLEVVKASVGGSIVDEGWASKRQLERFSRTANSYSVLGRDARHGRDPGDPPSNPMDFAEARRFILDIARQWLEWKVSKRA